MNLRIEEVILGLAVVAYLCFALFGIVELPTQTDEALYENPAISLVRAGHFGSSVMEPMASQLIGIDRVTYYALPGQPLTSAPLVALFGSSVLSLRLKSLVFMLLAAALLYRLLARTLSGPYPAYILALLLLDRTWLEPSTIARPDAQCFLFGLAGVYMLDAALKNESSARAAMSGLLIAGALITHLNGSIFAAICLVVVISRVWRDPRLLKRPYLWMALLGLLPVLGAYVAFTRLYPEFYKGQMGWNATVWDRLVAWHHPFQAVEREIGRWMYRANDAGLIQRGIYALVSALGLGALVFVAVSKGPTATSGFRRMLCCYAIVAAVCFCFLNNIESAYYFFYRRLAIDAAMIGGVWLCVEGGRSRTWRALAVAAIALIALFNVAKDASFLIRTRQEAARNGRLMAALRTEHKPDQVVLGLLEFAPDFDFSPAFSVDSQYGFYSGRRPDLALLYRNRVAVPRSAKQALAIGVAGGICADAVDSEFADFARFSGPTVTALVQSDRTRICSYVDDLSTGARLIYSDQHYDVVSLAGR